ncbi:hypothetical protein KSP40_PGU004973 [Platanthera guangdongensis]|uniref:Photosystem I assembly protein Ycf4 n=1 Tax=Platanthera guangdongensis TaxID=2320717 RepID=A0ABR2MEL1_9ASPA
MDPYFITFYLGLGIGVIRPAFDISIVIWGYHIHFFRLLLNRERGLIKPLSRFKRAQRSEYGTQITIYMSKAGLITPIPNPK